MPRVIHYDEAVNAIVGIAAEIAGLPWLSRIAIIDDLFGYFHIVLWLQNAHGNVDLDRDWPAIENRLAQECGPFWTGRRIVTDESGAAPDHDFCEGAWRVGRRPVGAEERLRYVDRHRSRTSWFVPVHPRPAGVDADAAANRRTPVVAFYSFKGGMGRTTAAAAYVLHLAQAGQRVVAIDLDLDAPGLGRLLGTEKDGSPNPWGTVDFLLESSNKYPLIEYRHVCARSELVGEQPVDVFPQCQRSCRIASVALTV